ncbi:hypothetical protein ACIO87_37880 [Streptomyces sp. NPDC087218]|uniref:hypothetical protein n=1 Tax=Streptomyces sp. NPDC087218 TaxID=3365769 RepID=UPI00382FC0D3
MKRGCAGAIPCGARWGRRLSADEITLEEQTELPDSRRTGGEGDRAGDPVVPVVDAEVTARAGRQQHSVPHILGV